MSYWSFVLTGKVENSKDHFVRIVFHSLLVKHSVSKAVEQEQSREHQETSSWECTNNYSCQNKMITKIEVTLFN